MDNVVYGKHKKIWMLLTQNFFWNFVLGFNAMLAPGFGDSEFVPFRENINFSLHTKKIIHGILSILCLQEKLERESKPSSFAWRDILCVKNYSRLTNLRRCLIEPEVLRQDLLAVVKCYQNVCEMLSILRDNNLSDLEKSKKIAEYKISIHKNSLSEFLPDLMSLDEDDFCSLPLAMLDKIYLIDVELAFLHALDFRNDLFLFEQALEYAKKDCYLGEACDQEDDFFCQEEYLQRKSDAASRLLAYFSGNLPKEYFDLPVFSDD